MFDEKSGRQSTAENDSRRLPAALSKLKRLPAQGFTKHSKENDRQENGQRLARRLITSQRNQQGGRERGRLAGPQQQVGERGENAGQD